MNENTTHGRTKAGVDSTDDVLNELAEQAEAGLDVATLRRRPGRPSDGIRACRLATRTARP